jgi:ABC-type branched-subunit amino acid transport system permease subunit
VLAGAKATRVITRPEFLGMSLKGDRAFYLFVVAIVLAGVVAVEVVRVTRLGRSLRALADSPVALQSLGVNPMSSQVLVFCLSAFLAGIAGALIGTLTAAINAEAYGFLESLIWVTVLIAAGRETLLGAIVAAALLFALPSVFTSPTVREWQPVAFGLGAIILAQAPNGLVGLLKLQRPDFVRLAAASRWRLEDGPLQRRVAEVAR